MAPTAEPTLAPTVAPTAEPTLAPTVAPTAEPTLAPTVAPTAEPTLAPTVAPTAEPTLAPTVAPTAEPTLAPTVAPTAEPTLAPTVAPTAEPTVAPSIAPVASDQPVVIEGPAVTGAITLPEDAVLTEGATWSVELQDASKMDVAAVTIGAASGEVADTEATEIPFAITYDSAAIDPRIAYTLRAEVLDADGNALYASDTVTPGIINGASVEQVVVQVQDVPVAAESPVAAVESPAA